MGDKTQLLALMLAARFRSHILIVAGIAVATLLNHALAAGLGAWIGSLIHADILRWILALSFFAMAAWLMVPDAKVEFDPSQARLGAFGTTTIAFFLVEMGDKTQIATVALAARYPDIVAVVAGTTLGMLIANIPAVYLGNKLLRRVPMRALQFIAAAMFAVLGVLVILA
jgi:putative Ca2+/H+ antiporter (TMEM165/GDT1 family)